MSAEPARKPGTLIMLSRLRDGADRAEYERWAAEVDRAAVLALPSIEEWRLHRVQRTLGDEAESPCEYVEVALVNDVDQLERDLSSDAAAKLTAELLRFCEPPTFLLTKQVA
jgi:REDY-like protein HapK